MSETTETNWRIRIQHTCGSHGLRTVAYRRMIELRDQAKGQALVEYHYNEEAGVDVVRVTWMNQHVMVVVAFRQGEVLVGVKVPTVLKLFRSTVESRVRKEIERMVGDAGGSLISITDA